MKLSLFCVELFLGLTQFGGSPSGLSCPQHHRVKGQASSTSTTTLQFFSHHKRSCLFLYFYCKTISITYERCIQQGKNVVRIRTNQDSIEIAHLPFTCRVRVRFPTRWNCTLDTLFIVLFVLWDFWWTVWFLCSFCLILKILFVYCCLSFKRLLNCLFNGLSNMYFWWIFIRTVRQSQWYIIIKVNTS